MPSSVLDILLNLISDLTAWIIVFLVASALTVSRQIIRQRRLLRFLGLSSERNRLRVYLSSFLLKPGAIKDLDGNPTMWIGLAISAVEFLTIPELDRWLSDLTIQSGLLEYLFSEIAPNYFKLPEIHVEYLPSPRSYEDLRLEKCVAIVLGGPLHNLATKMCLAENLTRMKSQDWSLSVRVTKGRHAGRILGPNISRDEFVDGFEEHDTDVGILEKLEDKERDSIVFICSGAGINGTRAAVHYLITHWQELLSRHGEVPFAVCLECPHADVDASGYLKSTVLLELP